MNSYLKIARKVLSETRQPLSARQILDIAYALQIVPEDLFGKTQHKTLHARIAEDILQNRGGSEFARTAPGRFCMRSDLPNLVSAKKTKGEYVAPVRAEQLRNFSVLCLPKERVTGLFGDGANILFGQWDAQDTCYKKLSEVIDSSDIVYVRIIVVLKRGREILIHRSASRFGDRFDGRISVGLIGFVKMDDRSLFSNNDYGLEEAASRTMIEQLYLNVGAVQELQPLHKTENINCIADPETGEDFNSIAALTFYECAPGSEADRHLSTLDHVEWRVGPLRFNRVDELDPWSREILESQKLHERVV